MKVLKAKLREVPSCAVSVDLDFNADWLRASAVVEELKRKIFAELKDKLHAKIATLSLEDLEFKIVGEAEPTDAPEFCMCGMLPQHERHENGKLVGRYAPVEECECKNGGKYGLPDVRCPRHSVEELEEIPHDFITDERVSHADQMLAKYINRIVRFINKQK